MSRRRSYEANAHAEFSGIQQQLASLAKRAHAMVTAGGVEAERALLSTQSMHDVALHRFELLKRASESGWDGLRVAFETSWSDLRVALCDSAKDRTEPRK